MEPLPVRIDATTNYRYAERMPPLPKHTLPLWKSLPELSTWISRNCRTCRFVECGLPGLLPGQACPLPNLALIATVRQTAPPDPILGVLYPTFGSLPTHVLWHAPYKCRSRVDKRGRPAKV
jgi:hypothetical protein